ncbi:MAG: SUMF1/EgtB/PvdO family nonheme iron enzyme [Anaerolineae bacterium]|nr:SUMF1/EgtB/PvdO family nonheme iron enzyme [Anaerolineae bacterium]
MPPPQTIGPYEIIDEVGRGGFAVVYRARHTKMAREVALKVIFDNHANDPAFVERFRQEAQTAAGLRHRRLVTLYEFGELEGRLYLAMELIPGPSLRDLLAERGPLPLAEALPLLTQLAEALDYLHSRQLVHRDLKPANVLLEGEHPRWQVTLADFGLVRSLEHSTHFTQTGSSLGTPAYFAPEQAASEKWGEISPLTDVYALGVLTFEMLLGRLPFEGDGLALIRAHADDEPVIPLDQVTELGDDLVQLLQQALAKPTEERFASARALAVALRSLAEQREATKKRQAELDDLLIQAKSAHKKVDWLEVQRLCVAIMQRDPAQPDALKMMLEATTGLQQAGEAEARRRERLRRYQNGAEAVQEECWDEAIAALEAVVIEDPDFKDAAELLDTARAEQLRDEAHNKAIAHDEAGRWPEACHLWLQVLDGRLDYKKGDALRRLLTALKNMLPQLENTRRGFYQQRRELKQSRQALVLYDRLAVALAASDWTAVIAAGEELLTLSGHLPQVERWLVQARSELDRKTMIETDMIVYQELPDWLSDANETQEFDPDTETENTKTPIEKAESAIITPKTKIWHKDGKKMEYVPAGEFLFGDGKERKDLPEFWIDKTPVTNAEYKRFLEANPNHPVPNINEGWAKPYNWDDKTRTYPEGRADHPVVLVSWQDAQSYAQWANKRLPTEEEWEKAARGTDGRNYPWGHITSSIKRCNMYRNEGGTTPVGYYSPQGDSPYGVVDMVGNVWEWTDSVYGGLGKVLRGGAWDSKSVSHQRISIRQGNLEGVRNNNLGFRCLIS